MRFLIFLPCFTYGGAEKQAAILAYRLLELGYEVEAWAFPSPDAHQPLRLEMEKKGIICQELAAWPMLDWHGLSDGTNWDCLKAGRMSWSRQLRKLSDQIPGGHFDIVVPFTFFPSLVATLFREKFEASVVIWNHRGGYDDAGIKYSCFLVRQILKKNPLFVANSKAGCLFLKDQFSLNNDSIHLVNNVFASVTHPNLKFQFNFERTSNVCQLVQVANFFPEKDFETLLNAMILLNESNISYHLHLVGSFPSSTHEYDFTRQLHKRGLLSAVTHHGSLNQAGIFKLFAECDIGILSSKSEGCPNAIMEYMYWGLPIVGTNIPGILDLVGETGEAYLFQTGNALQLRDHIDFLARNPDRRIALGRANQQRLGHVYNPANVFPSWFNIFLAESSGFRTDGQSKYGAVYGQAFTTEPPASQTHSLVSVVIPCFNQEKYLAETLESIFSQTYQTVEIIVIDDGSTDNTASVAKSYGNRIRFVQQFNKGTSAARNVGLELCMGKYIQYLDGDDLIELDKISKQVEFLEAHHDIGIVYSDVRYFTDDKPEANDLGPYVTESGEPWIPMLWKAPGPMINKIISKNMLAINCALVRKRDVAMIGCWNELLYAVEDWEYWVRCADAGVKFAYVSWFNTMSRVRLHSGSTSTQTDRVNIGQYEMSLCLARTLRDEFAIDVNWRRGIWWATRLETSGWTRRLIKIFRVAPQLGVKFHILGTLALGLHWPDHPIRRMLKRGTSGLLSVFNNSRKFMAKKK